MSIAQDATKAAYHSPAYNAAGSAMMSFTPVNQIHQHLCGLHVYAIDPSRSVVAHHFCTHLSRDLHQCVIYDCDKADARLIYVISEDRFVALPEEEKKYWHSHKFEVESGMLVLGTKTIVPNAMTTAAERPAMMELHRTYGKTIHTWQPDIQPDLPLGPPQLMMAYTDFEQVDQSLLDKRDKEMGLATSTFRTNRLGYLKSEDIQRPVAGGCDTWTRGDRLSFSLSGKEQDAEAK
ncbi:hypothetical protein BD324DRAFT_664212 [Kockovaella imperatae]|uniref:DUF1264-domain-containing protein n=1 Tax=Kockovaella imperatae TaxID=4999 RepID=A0A1Y1U913_9TREE|nr:hypothetical protein BD324DRAFT_664212 [Kockovaella imperatae]ORX34529.1 hypothetical protein BD324DRAFT_664212 [Kockovaella imperatae]